MDTKELIKAITADYEKTFTGTVSATTWTSDIISTDDILKEIMALGEPVPHNFNTFIGHNSLVGELNKVVNKTIDSAFFFEFGAIKVFSNPYCYRREQVRFPRSKKKRIRKKWAKNEKNFKNVPLMFAINAIDYEDIFRPLT